MGPGFDRKFWPKVLSESFQRKFRFLLFLLAGRLAGLGWAGLGWAGLGWAGLGWAGLGWAGLGWAGLGWAGRIGEGAGGGGTPQLTFPTPSLPSPTQPPISLEAKPTPTPFLRRGRPNKQQILTPPLLPLPPPRRRSNTPPPLPAGPPAPKPWTRNSKPAQVYIIWSKLVRLNRLGWAGRLAAGLGWFGPTALHGKPWRKQSFLLFIFVFGGLGLAKQDLRCHGIQFLFILSWGFRV